MAVQDKHPSFELYEKDWLLIKDSCVSANHIKSKTTEYLYKTDGQNMAETEGGMPKGSIYNAYIQKAQFPMWVKDAIRSMVGMSSKLEPTIELPQQMKGIELNATNDGFNLGQLYLRIIKEILKYGRCFLLADIDDNGQPFITTYSALNAINWKCCNVEGREDLNLVVLEEQRFKNDDIFSHAQKTVHRVLRLVDGQYKVFIYDDAKVEEITPTTTKGALKYIPCVFAGSTHNTNEVDEIPLLTMAEAGLKYYQLSADYFQSLFHTAHPQPWITGLDKSNIGGNLITSPMVAWTLPDTAKCGYMEISGVGIDATKLEMDAQKSSALESGAKVLDTEGVESGEARKARQNDQQATLHSIVVNAAKALEQTLKYCAEWIGSNPNEVKFEVDPDFFTQGVDQVMAKQLYEAALSNKISMQTHWDYLTKNGQLPSRTYEEEQLLIEKEATGSFV